MVPLTATGPKVYVATINTVLSHSYDSFVKTLNHMNSLKLRDCSGENVVYCYYATLVDDERLESARAFNPGRLGYIICIFEDNSDSRFHIWSTHNYKEVVDFIKKLCVCGEDVMQPYYIIAYGSLVQEAMCEYRSID